MSDELKIIKTDEHGVKAAEYRQFFIERLGHTSQEFCYRVSLSRGSFFILLDKEFSTVEKVRDWIDSQAKRHGPRT